MKVEFYYSILCPRCHYAGRALKRLQQQHPELSIEPVEVTMNLSRLRREKIRTIPTLKIAGRRLSGFLLTPGRIRRFLAEQGLNVSRVP